MTKKLLQSLSLIFSLTAATVANAQMSGVNAYIKGTSVEIGIAGAGGFEGCPTTASPPLPGMHFRSGNPFFGFVANPQVNAWATFDGDFFTPGSPENGWGVEIGSTGTSYGNNCSYLNQINGSITSWTHTFNCYSADWIGNLTTGTNLQIKINYFLQETDLFYTTTVSITNNTAATIPELFYYRNLDPDNNQPISGDFTTQNTIVSQPFSGLCNTAHVKATSSVPASQPMSYFGMAGVGANWRAGKGGFANRDASNMWNGTGFVQTVGATSFADEAVFLAYRIQNLAPGATETFKFVVILDDGAAANAINNSTFLSYPGSATSAPAVCTPYTDTVKICQGAPQTISVTGPTVASYTWTWSPSTGLSSSTGASVSANPATTTNYTVTGTPVNACFAPLSFPFVVSVKPSPTVTVPAPISVCAGASVPASAFTSTPVGATYAWTNSNPAIGLAASGTGNLPTFTATNTTGADITATITVTPTVAGNPCPGIASTYTITVKPNPVVTVNSATICPGQTATLTAAGATTYSWSTGATTNPISVSPATTTTYTVTGTTNGCTSSAISTVSIGGSVPVTVNSPTICVGQSATLTAVGATSYTWSTGAATNPLVVTPATTTSYTVTGTSGGCTGTAIATVTVNPLPVVTVNSPTICAGETATLTAGGATTYSWSSGATSTGGAGATATPAATTTYTVTGTTAGCSSTATSTVTVNPLPVITANSPSICPGETATITASGGTTYAWSAGATSTGANTASASPAATTTYTVTGTTAGCSSTATFTVTVASAMTITVNSPTICAGQSAVLTASGGTTYSWSGGETTNPITVTPAATTSYTVTGTTGGCTGTAVATVTVNPLPVVTVNSPTICAGETATLTAAGATGYTWSAGATSTGTNTASASPATTTTYTVTGTTSGCSSTAVATVTVNPIPVITVNSPTICPGATATLTASGGTSYTWSAGATSTGVNTATTAPAATTTYTVTGTSLGCSSTAVATVTVSSAMIPDAGVNDTICFGGSTTLMVIPNGPGYIYTWSPAATLSDPTVFNPTATPAATTDYTVTVTDPMGCSGTDVVQVYVDPQLTLAIAGIATNCNGSCDGQTIVIPSGGTSPFTYLWDSGCTNAACSGVCAGTYNVTVTDALGCTATASTTVTEPTAMTLTTSSTTAHCNLPDGSATLTASGGTPGYTYLWPDGQTTATAVNLVPGNYCVQVTDANGCTDTACVTVPNESGVVAGISAQTATTCNGVCDGTATASGTGGVGPYTYLWNTVPAQTTITATGLCAGTYVVTVTDASGCSDDITVTITEPTQVVIAPIAPVTICNSGSATLTASASGGNGGPYTYDWAPAGTGSSATVVVSPATTTVYTVTAEDVSGCPSASVDVTVTVNPPLALTLTGATSICPGDNATMNAVTSGGNGSAPVVTWAPGGIGTTATVSPAATTTYTVTANDGCSPEVSDVITITVLPLPVVTFSSDITSGCDPVCVNFSDQTSVAGGSVSVWNWNFGDGSTNSTLQNPTHCFSGEGSYTVTLTSTSGDGCVSTHVINNMITVHPIPVAAFTAPASASIVSPVITFENTSTGASSYTWNFGDMLNTNEPNTSTAVNPTHVYGEVGTYCIQMVATSSYGCADTADLCVVIDPEFSFYIPNAFTPNGDGINDEFFPKGDFFLEYEMFIYDRWGNMIFFSDDIDKHWKGNINNGSEIAMQDTYVYVINIVDLHNKKKKFIGSVTIVK
jgi:gliding motility-associated-like protein